MSEEDDMYHIMHAIELWGNRRSTVLSPLVAILTGGGGLTKLHPLLSCHVLSTIMFGLHTGFPIFIKTTCLGGNTYRKSAAKGKKTF